MKLKYIILSLLLIFSCISKRDVTETETLLKNNFEIIALSHSMGVVKVDSYRFIEKADSIDFIFNEEREFRKIKIGKSIFDEIKEEIICMSKFHSDDKLSSNCIGPAEYDYLLKTKFKEIYLYPRFNHSCRFESLIAGIKSF